MNFYFYDLFYTVIKNRNEKEIVNDEYEIKENDYSFVKLILLLLIIIMEKKMTCWGREKWDLRKVISVTS